MTTELYDFLWDKGIDDLTEYRDNHLSDVSARRGTYHPKSACRGENYPCIRVYLDKTDRKSYYRFAPCYRISGPTTVTATEIIDGEYNGSDELCFEWEDFSRDLNLIKKFALYEYAPWKK